MYLFAWEYFDYTAYMIGLAALLHAYVPFQRSRVYRREPNMRFEKFLAWHVAWHTALPTWTCMLLLHSGGCLSEQGPEVSVLEHERWYPDPLYSFY